MYAEGAMDSYTLRGIAGWVHVVIDWGKNMDGALFAYLGTKYKEPYKVI